MDWLVQRMLDGGRIMEKHVRIAGRVRGSIKISQEADRPRHRHVLVARLITTLPERPIPPLFDVTLVASTGSQWTLSGYERITAGPLQAEHMVVQSWLLEPAADEDLIKAEAKWNAAAREVDELRRRLA